MLVVYFPSCLALLGILDDDNSVGASRNKLEYVLVFKNLINRFTYSFLIYIFKCKKILLLIYPNKIDILMLWLSEL